MSLPYLIRSAMRCTPPFPFLCSAKMCSSPAPAPSASWPPPSCGTLARAMWSSRTSMITASISHEKWESPWRSMYATPSAFRDMLANMSHGAKIAMLGIPEKEMAIDCNTVIFSMLTIKGIYGREMYETWYKMTVMLHSGLDIKPVITHRFPHTDFERAFEVMDSGNSGRVLLNWE